MVVPRNARPRVRPPRRLAALALAATVLGVLASPAAADEQPSVALRSPTPGAVLDRAVTVAAVARDDGRVRRVVFSLDGRVVAQRRRAPYRARLALTGVGEGRHVLAARAVDDSGQARVARVRVTVRRPSVAPAGDLVFRGDFETGDLGQWHRAERPAADRIRVVSDVRRHGRYAARFELRPGELERSYSRAEVNTYKTLRFQEGDDLYFGWSTRFDPAWRDTGRWGKFLQWKQEGSGLPPMGMDVERDQLFLIAHRSGWKSARVPIARGSWHDWVVHVRFSSNPAVGFVEIWHDGVAIQARKPFATLEPGQFSYLKQGYYRAPDTAVANVLWHDGMRVGHSYRQVAPGA